MDRSSTNDKQYSTNVLGCHPRWQSPADKKTTPISREEVAFIDTLSAKYLLVNELLQIPQFAELWGQARKIPEQIIGLIKPRLEGIFANLSPQARGALLMGEKAYTLYDKKAINEAEAAAMRLKLLARVVDEVLQKEGMRPDYQSRLEAIVQPLGVPGLVNVMALLDMKEWRIDRLLVGSVEGAAIDLLESAFIRGLTDLSPVEAASEGQPSLKRRIRRKVSPLGRHLKRYALQQRIQLWVKNVVYGESITQIAIRLANGPDYCLVGYSPERWIKKQIREASRILEVKRPPGRPRKGGVLRQWKLMSK